MALNFNSGSVFNLTPIRRNEIRPELDRLLVSGEEIVQGFKTIRDQLVFTNKRVISIDVQGVTGKRKSYVSLPYAKIQFFTIQTPGLLEIVPDSEISMTFSDGTTARFEFKGNVNISELEQIIAENVL